MPLSLFLVSWVHSKVYSIFEHYMSTFSGETGGEDPPFVPDFVATRKSNRCNKNKTPNKLNVYQLDSSPTDNCN